MSRNVAVIVILVMASAACKRGSDTLLGPTATGLPGCSGRPINNVAVALQLGAFTAQLFGEMHAGQEQGGPLTIIRSVVPCEYEISGQMLSRQFQVAFDIEGDRPPERGGVHLGSITVVEGPNPRVSRRSSFPPCIVDFAQSPPVDPPFNFRIRFRVDADVRRGDANRCDW